MYYHTNVSMLYAKTPYFKIPLLVSVASKLTLGVPDRTTGTVLVAGVLVANCVGHKLDEANYFLNREKRKGFN